jgi:hypothetical protein
MKKSQLLLTFFVLIFALPSLAYDIDTHFYGTYSMARFSGIRHEVALKIASGTQWMDEAYISEPLSMIFLPMTGVKKRRLLHFPGTRQASKMTIDTLTNFLEPSTGVPLKVFTKTEEDHEFASEMLTEGLMEGNLMKASVGLHTLEDSYAHAGTISELGHAHFWHHPDRPFINEVSVSKYFHMCRSVLRAMVAIRSLLPMSAVDLNTRFGDKPNYQLNGDQLADIYEIIPDVRAVISRKILNEPQFVRFALDTVYKIANKVNYVGNGYDKYLTNFSSGQDTYEAAISVAKSFPPGMVDINAVMKDNGLQESISEDYLLAAGGGLELLSKVIRRILNDGYIPLPLNDYNNRFEKESDGPIWVKEIDLRVANMRGLIYKLYNKDIYFVPNNTSDRRGFIKEINQAKEAEPVMPQPSPTVEYTTYNGKEKVQFNLMIFSFIFPKLYEYVKNDLGTLVKLIQYADIAMLRDKSFMTKISEGSDLGIGPAQAARMIIHAPQALKIGFDDIKTSHIIPHSKNRFYVVPSLLKKMIDEKVYKPLMSNEQVDDLVFKRK